MIDTPTPTIRIGHSTRIIPAEQSYYAYCTSCGWEGGWATNNQDAQATGDKHLMRGCRKVQR